MNDTSKQKRHSKPEILAILRLQEKSTTTVTEFCRTHKIHKATFYNWRNRFLVQNESREQFVALQFCEPPPLQKLFAEIELPSKVRVKLFQEVEASYFKALML